MRRKPGDTMPLILATMAPAGEPGTAAEAQPEIFAALQGEGASAGMPVAFVRLSRCNLACVWCDTPYTWHFEGDDRPHTSGEEYPRKPNQIALEVADVAERILALGQQRLVITGGEPLLQGQALAQLAEHLPDMAIEIETNGTTTAPAALDRRIDQFNVSPKLAHSGNPADLALLPEPLETYAADPRAFFKFVIAEEDDVEEVLALQQRYGFASERVFLMPEGTSSEMLRWRAGWIEPLCLAHGFRFSDRLHIHLHGDTRGT